MGLHVPTKQRNDTGSCVCRTAPSGLEWNDSEQAETALNFMAGFLVAKRLDTMPESNSFLLQLN